MTTYPPPVRENRVRSKVHADPEVFEFEFARFVHYELDRATKLIAAVWPMFLLRFGRERDRSRALDHDLSSRHRGRRRIAERYRIWTNH